MSALRPGLPELPRRMRRLPLDARGYPVPWFVAFINGVPDFRVVKPGAVEDADRNKTCWLCGEPLGRNLAFVIGPMCAVNRVTSEPPCHLDCAIFGATACPFLARPRSQRRDANLPDGVGAMPGLGIKRNPGVALVWVTRSYRRFRVPGEHGRGYLFRLDADPQQTLWFAEGRPATRAEVMHSIETGLPILRAEAERDGPEGIRELDRLTALGLALVPAA